MTRTVGRHRAGPDRDPESVTEPEPAEPAPAADQPADPDLLAAVRGGDSAAFGVLYYRHGDAARRLARVLVRDPSDADDLVAEAFAKVLAALRRGHGPEVAFRAYLLTAVRHACYDRARRDHRLELTEDMTRYESADRTAGTGGDPSTARLDRSYAARAFAKLPERWQMVLWHTEVEGEKPAAIARMLGLSPNAVAALAYRARERLRQMYLQEHLHATGDQSCHWTATRLGAHVRDGLPRRERSRVDTHLADCGDCRLLCAELAEVNSGLRGVLAPVVLGTAASPYLAAAPTLTGWAVLVGWWHGLVAAVRDGWSAVVGWGRGQVRRYGPSNVAAGVGLAAAAAVGIGLFALALALGPDPGDEPPTAAEPGVPVPGPGPEPAPAQPERPPDPGAPPPGEPVPGGIDAPAGVTSPTAAPSSVAPPTAPPPASASPSQAPPPAPVEIAPDLSGTALTAADQGELAVTVRLPDRPRPPESIMEFSGDSPSDTPTKLHDRVVLGVSLPAGITLTGPDAGDGWRCRAEPGSEVACARPGWPAGESRTARVPVAVDETQGGFAPVTVRVTAGGQRATTSFRVPVAPLGQRVGYATTGRYRLAMAGNTWLSCAERPGCLRRDPLDNNLVPLVPYLPGGYRGEPAPPPGPPAPLVAASGAELAVPPGAEVAWAALHWATTAGGPDQLLLHSPASGWQPVAAAGVRAGTGRSPRQAYADVTGLVRAGGAGPWWAATADPLPTGRRVSAGWSLTVVYADPDAPRRDLAVFTDPVPLSGDLPARSLRTDARGGAVEVGLVAWEGDRTLTGDTLRLDGQPLGDPENLAASRATGALECGGAPVPECGWHTFGVDVATYRGQAATGPDGGEVTLVSGEDLLDIGVLVLAVEAPR